MAFTKTDLLLTDTRLEQLECALGNSGGSDPLEMAIAEADADVSRLTNHYIITDLVRAGFVRALALYKAWNISGAVPDEIRRNYEDVMSELRAIAAGERRNLPRVAAPEMSTPASASWGGRPSIFR